jgi:hypothetical protein
MKGRRNFGGKGEDRVQMQKMDKIEFLRLIFIWGNGPNLLILTHLDKAQREEGGMHSIGQPSISN